MTSVIPVTPTSKFQPISLEYIHFTSKFLEFETCDILRYYNSLSYTNDTNDILYIDIRSQHEYKITHIINAINIHPQLNNTQISDILTKALQEKFDNIANEIYFYCSEEQIADNSYMKIYANIHSIFLPIFVANSAKEQSRKQDISLMIDTDNKQSSIEHHTNQPSVNSELNDGQFEHSTVFLILENSFECFSKQYFPFLCTNNIHWDDKIVEYPSMIINNRLFLGNAYHAITRNILNNLGITHVINVTKIVKNEYENDEQMIIRYLNINISDITSENIEEYFSGVVEFVNTAFGKSGDGNGGNFKDEEQKHKHENTMSKIDLDADWDDILRNTGRKKRRDVPQLCKVIDSEWDEIFGKSEDGDGDGVCNYNKVLVHCQCGISRSATMVIAYLMKMFQMSYDESLTYVTYCRPIISPNLGFRTQLKSWEKSIKLVG